MGDGREIETTCCIAGGGPAGVMLGFLLARAGVPVVVLEKHGDFFRDFRGDTVHPSTLEVMCELGLDEEFLRLPHQEVRRPIVSFEGRELAGPDFSRLPVKHPFIALVPQWDLLNFLVERGRRYPGFDLRMKAEATDLIEERGRVVGVVAATADGALRVRAPLVVAADGRHSVVRQRAGLALRDFGVPIDVLWFQVVPREQEPAAALGRVRHGRILVTLPRDGYFQCGLIIRKGSLPEIQARGLAAFRADLAEIAPFLRGGLEELTSWDDVKQLTVRIDRLIRWHRPGLLCIGDAAHAMSPAFGVGINYAIQDAIATANLLAGKLGRGEALQSADLDRVQARREPPVRRMQAIQVAIHRRTFGGPQERPLELPWLVRTLLPIVAPLVRRVAARIVGLGFRPEHVGTPDVLADASGR